MYWWVLDLCWWTNKSFWFLNEYILISIPSLSEEVPGFGFVERERERSQRFCYQWREKDVHQVLPKKVLGETNCIYNNPFTVMKASISTPKFAHLFTSSFKSLDKWQKETFSPLAGDLTLSSTWKNCHDFWFTFALLECPSARNRHAKMTLFSFFPSGLDLSGLLESPKPARLEWDTSVCPFSFSVVASVCPFSWSMFRL